MLQQVRKSAAYNPGDDIYLDYLVAYKQYTIIVKIYLKSVVDAYTYVSDDDDYKKLTPEKVLTVSSYADSYASKNAANLTPRNYDLTTCVDMCVWQQRTVL